MADQQDNQKKEAFVGQQDRPDVQLDPDKPITSLRVRDLAALLGMPAKAGDKFFDKHPAAEYMTKHQVADKYVVKDVHDTERFKYLKDHILDTYHTLPPFRIPGPDPEIRQAIDLVVKEIAQLRQEVNQLKR
jgi:hypothetical protein